MYEQCRFSLSDIFYCEIFLFSTMSLFLLNCCILGCFFKKVICFEYFHLHKNYLWKNGMLRIWGLNKMLQVQVTIFFYFRMNLKHISIKRTIVKYGWLRGSRLIKQWQRTTTYTKAKKNLILKATIKKCNGNFIFIEKKLIAMTISQKKIPKKNGNNFFDKEKKIPKEKKLEYVFFFLNFETWRIRPCG